MIKVLEKHVADKIAAGEVVERPLSIIKELIENSIDAKAKSIIVEIKNGGKSYIRITDDGIGIHKDEVETAFLRHATSKVSTSEDLNHISTLGFRGEALAGISAVTRTEIITKVQDDNTGTHLVLSGGKVEKKERTGCPQGTTIIISDLFFNTPARRKFLKNDNVEGALIIRLISNIALAFAHIKIKLISNGNILFSTNGDGNKFTAISSIYKQSEYQKLFPINYNESGCKIEGYISSPDNTKTTRKYQTFFVNGRYIDSKVIEKGVETGYKERVFGGRYPIVFLFIEISPSELDVNIHPTKKEIRFDDDSKIISHIAEAIRIGLDSCSAIPEIRSGFDYSNVSPDVRERMVSSNETPKMHESLHSSNVTPENLEKLDYSNVAPENLEKLDYSNVAPENLESLHFDSASSENYEKLYSNSSTLVYNESFVKESQISIIDELMMQKKEEKRTIDAIQPPAITPFSFDDLNVLGVVFETYIIAEYNNTFYFIDQHAAHERILYEQFVFQYENIDKSSQMLLIPLVKDIDLDVMEYFVSTVEVLNRLGYKIEEFGENSYVIKEIPTFMTIQEAEHFFNFFVDNIDSYLDIKNFTVIDKLIRKSCSVAIKAHDVIATTEIDALIDDLKKCVNPYSCPHGRPTFIKLSKYEIEKMFKRV